MAGRFSNLEFKQAAPANVEAVRSAATPAADSKEILLRAQVEHRWGRCEPSLRLYTRAIQEDRGLVPAWVGQVQMLVQLGELREARLWADKALELFRDNGELLAAKAQACARLADKRAALACSDGSLKAPGSSPWRWEARGEVLLATGQQYHEECFGRALIEPAADWFDHAVVGGIYAFYGRMTNAVVHFRKALEMDAGCGFVWYQLGNCQAALAMTDSARASFQHCLDLAPNYRPAAEALKQLAGGGSLLGFVRGVVRRWRR